MAAKLAPLPSPSLPWVGDDKKPTTAFALALVALAAGNIGPLVSAANDAAAASAGVPVNGIYQSSGAVRIRLT